MNEIVHAGQTFNPFHRNRAIIFSILALALVALSFWGAVDTLALSKVDELIDRSFVLLLSVLAIDAVISTLQSLEIGAGLGIEIGQSLEPVDDGIGRLTNGLLLATGSLFFQDILLRIVSGSIAKWGFLVIAAMMVTSLLLAQSDRVRIACVTNFGLSHVALAQLQNFLIKTFIVATVVRFIVPTFMVASLLVSQAMVAPDIMENAQELERQEKTLSETESRISQARDEAVEGQTNQVEDLEVLGERKIQLEETRASLELESQRLDDRIREMQDTGWKDRVWGLGDDTAEALTETNARVRQTESDIEHKQSQVACIDRPVVGESCGPLLAEARRQALGEFRIRLESEQQGLQERLRSLQEARERHVAELSGGAQGEADSGWRDRISNWRDKATDALPGIGGDDSAEGAAEPTIEDIDHELAEVSTLVEQGQSELACVDRRITGEHCDSPAIDAHVQSALGALKANLESDLGRLRADLASYQGEGMRLAELKELEAERGRIEGDIEENKNLIDRNESELKCAEQLAAGEDCDSFFDNVRQMGASAVGMFSGMGRWVLDGLAAVKDMAKDMARKMARLLILVVIENILLPILFLAIALKASVPMTRGLTRISASMNEDARAALSNMDRALPHRKGGDSDKLTTT